MPFNIDHVIFHAGCPDGYTSAWLLDEACSNRPTFHEGRYGNPPPDGLSGTVVIADFSYAPETLAAIGEQCDRLVVLDHHETPVEAIEAWDGEFPPSVELFLDVTRSGCGITADWLSVFGPPALNSYRTGWASWRSTFVDYMEDRDLWRFSLPHCRAVIAVANATPMHPPGPGMFNEWATMAHRVNTSFDYVVELGQAVVDREDVLIAQAMGNTTFVTIGGYDGIPIVSTPYGLGSDSAAALCDAHPDAPFAAYYIDHDAHRQFGLRARPGSPVNLARLARDHYDGGGHPTAAGFIVPWGHELAPGTRF